jgi:hypothetical protein
MEVSVAAVIPVWNRRDLLSRLLDSLENQTRRPEEVLVIDNGSEDGAADLAEQRGARVIRLGRNTGFAHAVNRGVEEARSDRLAILNSDVELAPDWLQKLNDANVPFATGKIFSMSDPAVLDGTYDLLSRGGCPWRAGSGRRDNGQFCERLTIQMASFTAAVIDKELFRTVGRLDERFESYLEDVDFSLRCAERGINGAYVPEAVCFHHGSATLGRWNGGSVRLMARNQLFLIAKHYPRRLALEWLGPIFVAHTLWGILAARHGAGFPWLCGKWDGFRRFQEIRRAGETAEGSQLSKILCQQESAIFRLQTQLGMDWYWRVYFALTGAERHTKRRPG